MRGSFEMLKTRGNPTLSQKCICRFQEEEGMGLRTMHFTSIFHSVATVEKTTVSATVLHLTVISQY
jgi:hypothetical protein